MFGLVAGPAPAAAIPSGVLFGSAAAAAIGSAMAVVLEQQRKRKEEEARAAAEAARFNAAQIALEAQRAQAAWAKQQGLKAEYDAKLNLALSMGLSYNQIGDYQSMASGQGYEAAIAALDRYIAGAQEYFQAEAEFQAHLRELEAERIREAQEWLDANAEKSRQAMEAEKERQRKAAEERAAAAAAAAVVVEAEEKKSWWEKAVDGVKKAGDSAINFVDQHQVEISLALGVVAGAAAIVLTAGTATPLIVAAGAAALSAGAVVGAGTVGLNAYYDRPLDQNLIRNIGVSATAAAVTTVAPAFISSGQSVVAAAVPKVAAMAGYVGIPAAVTGALSSVAPAVGLGWSLWALGSMGVMGVGASYSADSTLKDEERRMGADLAYYGSASLQTAIGVYGVAQVINASFPEVGGGPSKRPSSYRSGRKDQI